MDQMDADQFVKSLILPVCYLASDDVSTGQLLQEVRGYFYNLCYYMHDHVSCYQHSKCKLAFTKSTNPAVPHKRAHEYAVHIITMSIFQDTLAMINLYKARCTLKIMK